MGTETTKPTKSDLTLPVALAATVPRIVLSLGFVFLRLKRKRRACVRAFPRARVRAGMGRDAANRLAADYEAIGRLRSYFPGKTFRLPFRF